MGFPVDLKKFLLSPTESFKFLDLEIDSKKMILNLQVVKLKKIDLKMQNLVCQP